MCRRRKKEPGLLTALDELMVDATAGDPLSGLLWTHKSLRKIQRALRAKGYHLSQTTISRLLRGRNYSMRVNGKRIAVGWHSRRASHR